MLGDVWLTRFHGDGTLKGFFGKTLGDIIVTIKHGKKGKWSHAMVEGPEGKLLDAGWSGVRLQPQSKWVGNKHYSFVVYRRELSDEKRALAGIAVEDLDGAKYSKKTLFAHLLGRPFARWVAERSDDDWICSEVTAQIQWLVDSYRFLNADTARPMDPNAARPCDIGYTCDASRKTWKKTKEETHGINVRLISEQQILGGP